LNDRSTDFERQNVHQQTVLTLFSFYCFSSFALVAHCSVADWQLLTTNEYTQCSKRIPDIIDGNLQKDYQIVIISVMNILTQLAIKRPLKFPPHPISASALPGEN